jgi:Flp pilus assembly protein TadD
MDEADSEYRRALRLRPDDVQINLESSRDRGATLAEAGRFEEAAAEFCRATELRPEDVQLWRFRALAHFAGGDPDAYRADCKAMLERFGATDDPVVACNVAYACTLGESAVEDVSLLLEVAGVASPQWHFGTFVRGAALYRAGRYGEAAEWFDAAAHRFPPRAWDWAFRAMARHRLGDRAEARRCLSEASRWIAEADENDGERPDRGRPRWGSFGERVVYPVLVREAEALMAPPENAGDLRTGAGRRRGDGESSSAARHGGGETGSVDAEQGGGPDRIDSPAAERRMEG